MNKKNALEIPWRLLEFFGLSERPFMRGRLCYANPLGPLRHTFELTGNRGYICRRCGCEHDGHDIHEAEFVNFMEQADGVIVPAGDWRGQP